VIADVESWPVFFTPTLHTERVGGDDVDERIRIWAFANDEVKTWTSRRHLDPRANRVEFSQEIPQEPVASMGGEWCVTPVSPGESRATLTHDFTAVGDDPAKLDLINRAVDTNSRAELDRLRLAAERQAELDDLMLTFTDTELVEGPVPAAYDFVYRCQDWPERLPHVSRLELREDVPGLQIMEMDTRSPDGSVHTTKSGRVCFADARIVYKQTRVPPIMTAHLGEWLFEEVPEGARLSARHTVLIKPEAVPELLGPDATVADAKARVREALGTNSTTTMRHAKAHVEAAVP
jgi:ribosome-associated toxin RatA of RatAB toxin-antitoxin module